jgi:hypothetical protein
VRDELSERPCSTDDRLVGEVVNFGCRSTLPIAG